ncbi:MAG: hypothetical protein CL940_06950 [Deltaproteobacteria bacterium]|nr:hypothetical protein [Deltaproteobacteria bacterium]
MKMTPQELEDALVEYLYDELDQAERARFEAALPDAPEIAREVDAHRRTLEAMEGLEDVPVPAGLLDGVLVEAERRADARVESAPSFLEQLIAGLLQPAALTLGLFFVVAITGYFVVERQGATSNPEPSVAVKAPPAGEAQENEEVPELEEESPSDETEASSDLEDNSGAGEKALELESAPAREDGATKESRSNDPVSEKTVARLMPVESDGAPSSSSPLGVMRSKGANKLGGKKRSRSVDRTRAVKTRKSKRRSKQLAAKPQVASLPSAPPRKKESYRFMGGETGTRGGLDEAAPRPRESINTGRSSILEGLAKQEAASESSALSAPRQAQPAKAVAAAPASDEAAAAPLSPWQQAERNAAQKKTSRSKAGVWLGAFERFRKSGQHKLARRALDRLAKLPGYAGVAKEKREALAGGKANSKAQKAPAKKAPAKKAPAKKAPATKKSK